MTLTFIRWPWYTSSITVFWRFTYTLNTVKTKFFGQGFHKLEPEHDKTNTQTAAAEHYCVAFIRCNKVRNWDLWNKINVKRNEDDASEMTPVRQFSWVYIYYVIVQSFDEFRMNTHVQWPTPFGHRLSQSNKDGDWSGPFLSTKWLSCCIAVPATSTVLRDSRTINPQIITHPEKNILTVTITSRQESGPLLSIS